MVCEIYTTNIVRIAVIWRINLPTTTLIESDANRPAPLKELLAEQLYVRSFVYSTSLMMSCDSR